MCPARAAQVAGLHSIEHDPGTRPQWHMPPGADDAVLFAPSAPTAKTLNERAVFVEPHSGHFTRSAELGDIARTSFSNRRSQLLHVYS